MKIIDIIPIAIIVAALLVNLAIGVGNRVDFSVLMIRCIIVTIVFGILGYMLTKTIRSAAEYSRVSRLSSPKGEAGERPDGGGSKKKSESTFDIKVPPLDDAELLRMDSDDNDDFVEVSPVHMNSFNRNGQE
ncbi:MAG TPA: hypothetical protein VN580_09230 [Clostridia bacterium]|nr:hypothetical protein [Clostridia bacterium]